MNYLTLIVVVFVALIVVLVDILFNLNNNMSMKDLSSFFIELFKSVFLINLIGIVCIGGIIVIKMLLEINHKTFFE
jgi:hypothetical protein